MRPGISKGRVEGQRMNLGRFENETRGLRIESGRSQNEPRDVWELKQFLLVSFPDLIWHMYHFQGKI